MFNPTLCPLEKILPVGGFAQTKFRILSFVGHFILHLVKPVAWNAENGELMLDGGACAQRRKPFCIRTTRPGGGIILLSCGEPDAAKDSLTADSLDIEAGGFERCVKGHDEILEETEISENIRGEIPRKPGFDFDDVCANYEFYVVIINLAA